ncbi:MAG: BatD family protein [Gammaproteobacteria bacterium]
MLAHFCRASLICLGWWLAWPAAAEITLDIAPDPIVADASCQLTFKVVDDAAGDPDFSPLEASFDILRRNRQTAISWVNGRSERQTTWVLEVMPRRTGTIEIPAIDFGIGSSPPRTVEVVGSAPAASPDKAAIILEVDATPRDPYVQEQVIYTVRLLRRVELSNPRFSPLETSSDAIIKALGDGLQSMEKIDGVSYEVVEQRYAIFPQKSGPLTIDPLVLTTQIVSGRRSLFDPFAHSMQTRRVESAALELDVKAVPAAYPDDAAWLPARRLRLHEEWEPDVSTTEPGTPVSRTLFLWADGLIAGQLPQVTPARPAGVKVYPDQPQSNEQATASGFTAVRQQKFAILGSSPGAVSFAALSVPWWNTETDQLEQASLPARRLLFEGAAADGASPAADASALPAVPDDAAEAAAGAASAAAGTPPAGTEDGQRLWMSLSAAFALAWLATLGAWWYSRRSGPAHPRPLRVNIQGREAGRTARASNALRQACAANDAEAARTALLDWAQGRDAGPCRHLRDVVAVSTSAALRAAVIELERALYGGQRQAWQGDGLWQAFRLEPATPPVRQAERRPEDPLPPLFKLGERH